jgi:hypothetical protein
VRSREQRRLSDLERRLVWIMGSPRTGSSWLAGMLVTLAGAIGVDEPQIGLHLGTLAPDILGAPARSFRDEQLRWIDNRRDEHHYFFNDQFRPVWQPALRDLILKRLAVQLSDEDDGRRYVIVKEPNGSAAADVLLAAMPAARLLFLVRDGRDVIDSQLDAIAPGAWLAAYGGGHQMSAEQRLVYIEERARRWVVNTQIVRNAFSSLPQEQRLLIRYEDLLADPRQALDRALLWLGAPSPADIDEVISSRAISAVPDRGKGRFARAARPGIWRENLNLDEQRVLAGIVNETLVSLGYEL